MIVTIFLIMLLTFVFGFLGKTETSLGLFYIDLVLSVMWFIHHLIDKLNISF
jgi:hypothetical protein